MSGQNIDSPRMGNGGTGASSTDQIGSSTSGTTYVFGSLPSLTSSGMNSIATPSGLAADIFTSSPMFGVVSTSTNSPFASSSTVISTSTGLPSTDSLGRILFTGMTPSLHDPTTALATTSGSSIKTWLSTESNGQIYTSTYWFTGTPTSGFLVSTLAPGIATATPSSALSHSKSLSPGQLFAAIFIPILFVFVSASLLFVCCRRRHKRKAGEVRELKVMSPTFQAAADIGRHAPRFGPLDLPHTSNTMNSGYHTGIDRSLVAAHTPPLPLSDSAIDDMSHDPPPAYKPRDSTPKAQPLSPGLIHPQPIRLSERNLATHRLAEVRSPFADPRDDDAVSEISDIGGHVRKSRQADEMSVVSDLSHEEIRAHHMF
ncbi:MAG: hypothetical protein M1827_003369 [Pycnora praestabilis]|nr:MAG: hypothetical protein M1827_003369 [Pycnora praestabilis]